MNCLTHPPSFSGATRSRTLLNVVYLYEVHSRNNSVRDCHYTRNNETIHRELLHYTIVGSGSNSFHLSLLYGDLLQKQSVKVQNRRKPAWSSDQVSATDGGPKWDARSQTASAELASRHLAAGQVI